MRFFYLLFSLVSVVVRLLVVAAPFLYMAYGREVPELKALAGLNLVYWGPVWAVVTFFLLFGRGLFRSKTVSRDYSSGAAGAASTEEGKHFDFLVPGTVEYHNFNQGAEVDHHKDGH